MQDSRKTIVITGGAKGLGSYLATSLCNLGHRLVILDHSARGQCENSSASRCFNYYEVDVSDWGAVDSVVDDIVGKYKGIDVLVNNAASKVFKEFIDLKYSEIERYIALNLQVPVLLTRKILPIMLENRYGRIINISSKSAFWGYRLGSMYCSTKSALILFSEGLGRELNVERDNVTINVICPDALGKKGGAGEYDWIVETIKKRVFEIIDSNKNGEVIPVFRTRTKLIETLDCFKKHLQWITKYS